MRVSSSFLASSCPPESGASGGEGGSAVAHGRTPSPSPSVRREAINELDGGQISRCAGVPPVADEIVPWLGFARRKSTLSRYASGWLWAMRNRRDRSGTIPLGNVAVARRCPGQFRWPIGHRNAAATRRSRGSPQEVDGDVLSLCIAVE